MTDLLRQRRKLTGALISTGVVLSLILAPGLSPPVHSVVVDADWIASKPKPKPQPPKPKPKPEPPKPRPPKPPKPPEPPKPPKPKPSKPRAGMNSGNLMPRGGYNFKPPIKPG